jgi:hypothetical protein
MMEWAFAGLTLLAIAFWVRRFLRMDLKEGSENKLLGSMSKDLHPLYSPLAQEIETQITILGITLNDAFGEREAGAHEMSWNVMRLARGEWTRLNDLVIGLNDSLANYLPTTNEIFVFRRIAVGRFKSRVMLDKVRMYEFLDQLIFSSKRRFGTQLRLLSSSTESLSKEFHRTCREGARSHDASNEVWSRIDVLFHDFDLIAKETLLAFRTLLSCQSPERAQDLAAELHGILERKIKTHATLLNQ